MEDDETPRYDDNGDDQIDQEMQAFVEIFSRFKTQPDDECIDVQRLMHVLQAFGRNPSLKDSQTRIEELEATGKLELTLEDVLQVLNEPWTVFNNDRDALHQALAKFDNSKDGYIDIEHFRTVMTTLGEPLDDEELEALVQLGLNEDQTKINIEYLVEQLLGNMVE